MPMVLRSRKSIHPSQASEVELDSRDAAPPGAKRSTRLHGDSAAGRATYEESEESDSESVQSDVMEKRRSGPVELEEEAAAKADLTDLKFCSVVLDRLHADDKTANKELEDKEDMNRKSGKLTSRIPTFHKRPTSAGQNTELPVLRKDTPAHVAQPLQKPGSGSLDALKSKPLDVRETALPLPSVRTPRVSLEGFSPLSSPEQSTAAAQSSLITAPKSWSLSGSEQLMTASPRPALRPEQGSQQHLPEQNKSKTSEVETDSSAVAAVSLFPPVGQKPQEEAAEKYDADPKPRIPLTASGYIEELESEEIPSTPEVCHVDTIIDEEPPWVTEPMNTLELKDSRSSSDVECEEELGGEKVDDHHKLDKAMSEFPSLSEEGHSLDETLSHAGKKSSEEGHSLDETLSHAGKKSSEEGHSLDETLSHAGKKSSKTQSSKTAESSGRSSCVLFCFLPTILLLLGGFSQHVWHYGLPMSVAQLTAQLELHWLEGFGLAAEPCSTDCRVNLVESIPVGLYPSSPSVRHSIADSWLHLLDKANSSVHIAAFYFTLRASDLESADSSDFQGRQVFEHLKQLESRGVNLQLAVNAPQTTVQDTADLTATGAEVREVNLKAVTGGIVHTKLWVVDQKHLFLGSANMDWRSLSQVKEVGLSVEDCGCLAQDAYRIFGVYWSIGDGNNGSLPPYWPARLSALSSSQNPLRLKFNGVPARVYLSSAPPQISARGRSDDLSTILSIINDAQKFVYISVMDYLPLSQYTKPLRFWPPIDSALRAAGCTRGVQVRLMVSCWDHSPPYMFTFLQSLLVLSRPPLKCDIDVKIFTVPSTAEQMKIPFARVNHAKFMVTDRVLYIGTSNWSENYFTQTAGVGLVVNQTGSVLEQGQQTLQSQAEELFLRDWRSQYASTLSVDSVDVCPRNRQ